MPAPGTCCRQGCPSSTSSCRSSGQYRLAAARPGSRGPIGDDGEIDAGRRLEQLGRQVLGAADIDGPDIERAGFCLRGSNKVCKGLEFRAGAGRKHEIEKSQAGDWLEIPQGIEW